jgi:putative ABC transport system permease protein
MVAATPFLGPEAGSSVGGPAVLVAVGAVGLGAPVLILLGLPLLQRCAARWGLGALGSDEIAARPGRLGSVLTLMTLGIALAVGNIGAAFTTADADHPQVVAGSAAVEMADAAEPRTARAVATATGAVVSPTVTSAGWIETPYDKTGSDPLPVVGVDHADSFVKPRTSSGSLDSLVGTTIAVTEHDADALGLQLGDEVGFRFGDGAAEKLRVVAILDAGRSERARIVPYGLLAAHTRSLSTTLLVRSELSTTELDDELDRAGVEAQVSSGLDTQGDPFDNLGALIYLVVGLASLAFATLVAGNSIVALTLSRRPELWAWRLVGATRRQVQQALVIEAGYLATVSAVVGVAIGAVATSAIAFGFGRLPSVPPLGLCVVPLLPAVAIVVVVLLAGSRATRHAGADGAADASDIAVR